MLKYAGWDAIVIEGKADSPVWVDIRNGQVIFMMPKTCGARIRGPHNYRFETSSKFVVERKPIGRTFGHYLWPNR